MEKNLKKNIYMYVCVCNWITHWNIVNQLYTSIYTNRSMIHGYNYYYFPPFNNGEMEAWWD